MSNNTLSAILKNPEDTEWTYFIGQEGREDSLRWKTLIGDDESNTQGLTYGIMEMPQGTFVHAHFHADNEVFHILKGEGVALIDKDVTEVGPGAIFYIPGNTVHGIRNTGQKMLKVIWVFPSNKFSEIEYHLVDRSF